MDFDIGNIDVVCADLPAQRKWCRETVDLIFLQEQALITQHIHALWMQVRVYERWFGEQYLERLPVFGDQR